MNNLTPQMINKIVEWADLNMLSNAESMAKLYAFLNSLAVKDEVCKGCISYVARVDYCKDLDRKV